ncbi:MAG: aconitate hydratase [Desulfatitalea sp. BRH_c12]|nr:MAG: aconitate hydratase [Desulfatitalea sp. BRH_c12]
MNSKEFRKNLSVNGQTYHYYDIQELETRSIAPIKRLPFSVRILVENLLRKLDGHIVKEEDLKKIGSWQKTYSAPVEIPYHPARVLMQDFTGVPAVVDLAAMRDAVKHLGGDTTQINPLVPVELIVDHSVQIDYFGTTHALEKNVAKEYERNGERYKLLKWAQKSFDNFKVVPPNSGICHQVNLEHLGRVVIAEQTSDGWIAYPDTLVGTDSHTTMINAIGVMGWGVGGIEAEAVMLGQPYYMSIPEVIGVKLIGRLKEGITATDLVLKVTEVLRKKGVVEKFVEYFGPGLKHLSIPDRATIANMSPEYGATMGFFPVDEQTLDYLRSTDRDRQAQLVEAYTKATGLFYTDSQNPEYTEILEIDLSAIELSLAGPARPQDRIPLSGMKEAFAKTLGCAYNRQAELEAITRLGDESGNANGRLGQCTPLAQREIDIVLNNQQTKIGDGHVVIAAITSCTNTSNPHVLIGAGLLAKAAVERGLKVPPTVKTSLAPGSRVVIDYLQESGLLPYLEALGFHLAAFGCTTCIGNSGPLAPAIEQAIVDNDLNVAAVLSGNRNFEARIHAHIKSNFLASPMLVVAYALAGRIDIDPTTEPLGLDPNGGPVYLDDLWPSFDAIDALVVKYVRQDLYAKEYGRIFEGDQFWKALQVTESATYAWDADSTYIKRPPYFDDFKLKPEANVGIENARAFLLLGDSVTTDHISPAGGIPEKYPAGQHLIAQGVPPAEFNSYGSRRGNHEVMMRGTFANVRIKNKMLAPKEGGWTLKYPEKEELFNYEAAMQYKAQGVPLIVVGGKEYGTGSSRDWAAKGTTLLGIQAVLAESFERIHRNNLVGMGVLPLVFKPGENAQTLGLDGSEVYAVAGTQDITPRQVLTIRAVKEDGKLITFQAIARLDTEVDVIYFQHGGILPYVLRKLMNV